jgi:hypothetical protein
MARKQIADSITCSIYRRLHVNCTTTAVLKAIAERLVEETRVIE